MIKKVTAVLFFGKEDEAKDFYHDCEKAFPKSIGINPEQTNEEHCFIRLEECHHDETPASPCVVLNEMPSS